MEIRIDRETVAMKMDFGVEDGIRWRNSSEDYLDRGTLEEWR